MCGTTSKNVRFHIGTSCGSLYFLLLLITAHLAQLPGSKQATQQNREEAKMSIPTYEQWKALTTDAWKQTTRLDIRSPQLQSLDATIEKYNKEKSQNNLSAIKNAFEVWKQSKGDQWQRSDRNKKGAMENLAAELDNVDSRGLTKSTT